MTEQLKNNCTHWTEEDSLSVRNRILKRFGYSEENKSPRPKKKVVHALPSGHRYGSLSYPCVRCGKPAYLGKYSTDNKIVGDGRDRSHRLAVCNACEYKTEERFCLSCGDPFQAREAYRICDPCKNGDPHALGLE